MKILQINEIRKAYFLQAFNRPVEDMLIISMGACNYNCPYCKRDGQFKGDGNNIITAYDLPMDTIFSIIDKHISLGHRIRLSGGDPCMFPLQAHRIAQYCVGKHGQKISIAHNGSSPELIKSLAPYLDYAAIDIKGPNSAAIAYRAGLKTPDPEAINKIKKILQICADNGILVDARTVIFADTMWEDLEQITYLLQGYDNTFLTLRSYSQVEGCQFKQSNADIKRAADSLSAATGIKVGYRNKWTGCDFYISGGDKNVKSA